MFHAARDAELAHAFADRKRSIRMTYSQHAGYSSLCQGDCNGCAYATGCSGHNGYFAGRTNIGYQKDPQENSLSCETDAKVVIGPRIKEAW